MLQVLCELLEMQKSTAFEQ